VNGERSATVQAVNITRVANFLFLDDLPDFFKKLPLEADLFVLSIKPEMLVVRAEQVDRKPSHVVQIGHARIGNATVCLPRRNVPYYISDGYDRYYHERQDE
jgi:hypothetical protein